MNEMVKTAPKKPGDMLRYLISEGRAWYVFQLLLPFAFLAVLSPFALVATGPLGFNLLSTHGYQHLIQYHYTTVIVAIFVVATAIALAEIRPAGRRRALAVLVLVLSVWGAYLWGPSGWSRKPMVIGQITTPRNVVLQRAEAPIPPDAAVSANSWLVPRLTHRRYIFNFPTPFRAEYWANPAAGGKRLPEADLVEHVITIPDSDPVHNLVLASLKGHGFETLIDQEGVLLLHRQKAR